MKHILTSLLLLPLLTTFSQGDLNITWDQEALICKETERAEILMQLESNRNEFAYQTDMHYQRMKWDINPANYYIKGEITYYFKSLIPDLKELILDLTNDLQINSIQRGSTPLNYSHGISQLLKIQLGKTLTVGEYDSLTINYEGAPPSNGFGSFEQNEHNGSPIIWTLSEPYGCRDWWPSKQDLVDKVDSVDIYITTPPGNLAASNGKLISISNTDGALVHHWRHRYPIVAYLIALAVTDYTAYSQFVPLPNGDSIEILNYVYPESLEQSKEETKASIDIMQFFNEVFGIYPFAKEKYGHAEFGWGGGIEHQTMSFMGNFSFDLQAHEMAHQWFGDKVTCGSWTDIWLNEGFATYMTGLTYERFSPTQFWPAWKSATSNNATSQPGGSVWVNDTTNVGRIFDGRLSYNKASYLLHMARWVSGDSAFFQACRNYLDIPGTAYDFGRTAELKGYLENETGRDFDEFLADWFYGQGYPSYHLTFQDWQDNDSLVLIVHQLQSHPSVSFFEMPIPILVVLDGVKNIFRVENTHQDQRFSFFIGGANVDSVGFDPDKWILSRNNIIEFEMLNAVIDPMDESFIIYPNPAQDWIDVKGGADIISVDIINTIGLSTHVKVINNKIDLSQYFAGVYTLILKDQLNKVLSIKRLIIQK